MFGTYFYHSHIRKTVAAFGTLFNDISVKRKDKDGNTVNSVKVPLSYGPKQKFLTRLLEEPDLNAPEVAIRLPRMSFEITGFQYDTSVKLNKMNVLNKPTLGGTIDTVRNPVPYILTFQLIIYTKNQDDSLQIVEQILPYFNPEYVITIKQIPELGIAQDVPIVLQSVSYTDDYEGEFASRRVLQYALDFSMKVFFYGPIKNNVGIIKDSTINVHPTIDGPATYAYNAQVNPLNASIGGTYNIDEALIDFDFE
jgi:hypothetical protein